MKNYSLTLTSFSGWFSSSTLSSRERRSHHASWWDLQLRCSSASKLVAYIGSHQSHDPWCTSQLDIRINLFLSWECSQFPSWPRSWQQYFIQCVIILLASWLCHRCHWHKWVREDIPRSEYCVQGVTFFSLRSGDTVYHITREAYIWYWGWVDTHPTKLSSSGSGREAVSSATGDRPTWRFSDIFFWWRNDCQYSNTTCWEIWILWRDENLVRQRHCSDFRGTWLSTTCTQKSLTTFLWVEI